ncbi:hypothetical protein Hanom_Chr10g00875061 [Helianthus anomalus]
MLASEWFHALCNESCSNLVVSSRSNIMPFIVATDSKQHEAILMRWGGKQQTSTKWSCGIRMIHGF